MKIHRSSPRLMCTKRLCGTRHTRYRHSAAQNKTLPSDAVKPSSSPFPGAHCFISSNVATITTIARGNPPSRHHVTGRNSTKTHASLRNFCCNDGRTL